LAALVTVAADWASRLPEGSQLRSTFLRLHNANQRLLRLDDKGLARAISTFGKAKLRQQHESEDGAPLADPKSPKMIP
jgi:hypothetical protein